MNEAYGFPINSSANHSLGRKGAKIVEEARQHLKDFLNAENYEVTFTGSGTEASNLVLFGSKVNTIFFSEIEHASVYNSRPSHSKVVEIKALQNGLIDIADLEKKLETIKDKNFLVSIMLSNNETGAIQPVEQIAKLVHQKGGLIHSDIVQGVGKISVDLEQTWAQHPHLGHCTASCPDCLRSYNNRRIHGFLNWRLALDAVDLALGRDLNLSRWTDSGAQAVSKIADTNTNLKFEVMDLLPVLTNTVTGKAFVFGHPLWSVLEHGLTADQSVVGSKLRDSGHKIEFVNLFELERSPIKLLIKLKDSI
jgi:hypothetical protein